MLSAIIFDMDGVLADSEPLHDIASKKVFEEFGFGDGEMLTEDLNQCRGRSAIDFWTHIFAKHNIDFAMEDFLPRRREIFVEIVESSDLEPIPGVRELLNRLHGEVPLALASSSSHMGINSIIKKLDIEQYFDIRLSGQDVLHTKPAPDIFLETAKRLEVSSDLCLVIEDSFNGVAAAKAAGMVCIGYKGSEHNTADLSAADTIITHFDELDSLRIISLFYS